MAVYLIHFERRYKHAGHYIGYSADLAGRIRAHRENQGARLLQVVNEAGIAWEVVRVWLDGDYALERELKGWKKAPQLCPVCNPRVAASVVQPPSGLVELVQRDVLEASAFVGWLRGYERSAVVGDADLLSGCPLGWWLASLYGGVWEVNAAAYRWRKQEWLPWQPWQPLPPWAVVFVDGLFRHFGNGLVSAEQALQVLRWSVGNLAYWRQVEQRVKRR